MRPFLFILMLGTLGFSGSAYMAVESASYFSGLYHGENALFLGWASAILAEGFQHLYMLAKIKTENRQKERLINGLFRFLVLLVFGLTIIAAGYNVAKPKLDRIFQNEQKNHQAELLQKVIRNRENDSWLLSGQRRNTAVAVQERRKAEDQLMNLYQQKNKEVTETGNLYEVFYLFAFRFVIQLCTLTSFWLIGFIYREGKIDQPADNSSRQPAAKKLDPLVWRVPIREKGKIVLGGKNLPLSECINNNWEYRELSA